VHTVFVERLCLWLRVYTCACIHVFTFAVCLFFSIFFCSLATAANTDVYRFGMFSISVKLICDKAVSDEEAATHTVRVYSESQFFVATKMVVLSCVRSPLHTVV